VREAVGVLALLACALPLFLLGVLLLVLLGSAIDSLSLSIACSGLHIRAFTVVFFSTQTTYLSTIFAWL
jgi:hypothetical protein